MKLHTKLPLLLITLIIIPLIIVNLLAYDHLQKSATKEAFFSVSSFLDQIADKSDNKIAVATANINLFANYPLLRYYMQAQDAEERYGLIQRPTMKKLMGIQKAATDYHEIRVMLPDGKVDLYLNNRKQEIIENRGAVREILSVQDSSSAQATYHYNKNTGELSLYATAPLFGASGTFSSDLNTAEVLGHLAITIDTDFITQLIREMPIGNKGGLLLSDAQGRILAAPDSLDLG